MGVAGPDSREVLNARELGFLSCSRCRCMTPQCNCDCDCVECTMVRGEDVQDGILRNLALSGGRL